MSYISTSRALLGELRKALNTMRPIHVQWPGQVAVAEVDPAVTYAVVFDSLVNEVPITLGKDPLYRSQGQITFRVVASLKPAEIRKSRELASEVKDIWRRSLNTLNLEINTNTLQIAERPPQEGRYLIDVVLTYNYYNQDS